MSTAYFLTIASPRQVESFRGFDHRAISCTMSSNGRPQKKAKKMQQGTLTGFMKASKVKASDTQAPGDSNDGQFKLFVDLDGVLVDFDGGVKRIFNGQSPEKIPVGVMWAGIGNQDAFYEDLSWTSDGKELWNAVKDLRPNILMGESSKR